MSKQLTLIKDESFKIRTAELPDSLQKKILKEFTYSFYKESACQRCEWLPDRHSENCDSCPAFLGRKATAKIVSPMDNPYEAQVISVPRGGKTRLSQLLRKNGYDSFTFEKHPPAKTRLSRPIKLVKSPYQYQIDARDAFIEARHGVISSPPRSGKCVTGDTIIKTDSGLVRMDSLFYGLNISSDSESIFESSHHRINTPCGLKEISHLYTKVVDTTVRLTTEHGECLQGTPNHPVLVLNPDFTTEWVQLQDLKIGDKLISDESYFGAKILALDLINNPTRVYDVCVPGPHCFIGNGFVNHNTVMGSMIVCELGLKTIIIASQREWLSNFKETFIGSSTQEKFTNALPRQVAFAKTFKDFESYDICLATFQQFMSEKGKALLEKIKNLFPVLIVDEVHGVPALQTARVLSRFNTRYTLGLSGTPDRKAGDYVIAEDLVGPIIFKAKVDRLRPAVSVLNTPGAYQAGGTGNAAFTYLISKLENNTPRRKSIVAEAIKRAKQGHLVLIPLTQVDPVLNYTREINEIMGPKYALPFYGGLPKDKRVAHLEAARNYECKIIVGNINLIQTGTNIPRASCLIDSGINSNIPKAIQRFSRILTPYDDKPTPLIIFTLDDCKIMRKTRRNEYWNALSKFDPIVDRETQSTLNSYFSNAKKSNSHDYTSILRDGI